MEFTFNSKSLERQVALHEIHQLSVADARKLHAELVIAVQAMDDKVNEAQAMAQASGIPADKDWIHRVKKKRRICVAFATQVKQVMESSAPAGQAQPTSFATVYQQRLDELLLEELGQTIFDEIKAEARDLALADLQVPTQGA
jgi:hypothetical protein